MEFDIGLGLDARGTLGAVATGGGVLVVAEGGVELKFGGGADVVSGSFGVSCCE